MKLKTLKGILVFVLFVAASLSACSAPSKQEEDQLAKIDYAKVEVGLGSPTPVSVTIDVSYPTTCSQISQVKQKMEKNGDVIKIVIEIRTADMGEVCNPDPASFRMVIPLNAIAMPKGMYQVEVNGVDAGSFEFKN